MVPIMLTDGGIGTSLAFHEGLKLPCFAAFPLVDSPDGRSSLRRYFEPFLTMAKETSHRFVLDTPTWRANPDWGVRLGYTRDGLARCNRDAVDFARELAAGSSEVMLSGALGPRGDGYFVGERMSAARAQSYHSWQIEVFAEANVDRITILTLSYPDEATGAVRAAMAAGLPVVASFTVETDGRLPDGTSLRSAIEQVDSDTGGGAAFFMVNCAHPSHLANAFDDAGPWMQRIGGLRANASVLSHAELDEALNLDEGDPAELVESHRFLRDRLSAVELLGGCCGTDHRHLRAIVDAWTSDCPERQAVWSP
jgi:homocysteine S-methyltransferase